MPKKICFVSDKHRWNDDRIYWKLAHTLKQEGYDVTHICKGNNNSTFISDEGIKITTFNQNHITGLNLRRKLLKVLRFKRSYYFLLRLLIKEKADIYIISDIDPLICSTILKKRSWKPKVIYDVHDPFYINIVAYSRGFLQVIFASIYALYTKIWELKKASQCDLILTTEVNWKHYFKKNLIHPEVKTIHNYPIFELQNEDHSEQKFDFIYTGTISEHRGLFDMIDLIHEMNKISQKPIKLLLLGEIHDKKTAYKAKEKIKTLQLTKLITLINHVPHHEVAEYYYQAKMGLILFQNTRNHRIILPIKLFEYMIFGLPIIGTNIGHIEKTIHETGNGIIIPITEIKKSAQKCLQLLNDKDKLKSMRANGIAAVQSNYHWSNESPKLIRLIQELNTTPTK